MLEKILSIGQTPVVFISVFVICFIGYAIGAIKVKGLNLGTAGVFLFALLFGYLCTLPGLQNIPVLRNFYLGSSNDAEVVKAVSGKLSNFKFISNIGLVLFVTSVGLIAGPKFFRDLKANAKSYVPMGALIVLMGALVTAGFALIPGIGSAYATGILSGALTSTPAFSAAQGAVEAIDPNKLGLVSLGHAVAYPFGVIGVVLFVQIMPRILKADIAHERTLIGVPAKQAELAKKERKLLELDEFGFGAFGLTVLLGILLGSIKIPLGGKASFSLGMTGGPLLMGLVLAHFGRIGKISLKVDENALKSFREFGLMLFLVGAGVDGGVELVQQIANSSYGIMIVVYGFVAGALMTLMPMVIGFVFGKKICKLPLLNNLGSITGGMTSTPALGTLIGVAGTDDVAGAYASTYPLALVLMVLASQLINTFIPA